jgi:hypothetical protein
MYESRPVDVARPSFPAAAMSTSAWEAGFAAAADQPVARCPFAAGTREAWSYSTLVCAV